MSGFRHRNLLNTVILWFTNKDNHYGSNALVHLMLSRHQYRPKRYFVYEANSASDFALRESDISYVVLSTSATNRYELYSTNRKPGEFKTAAAAKCFWFLCWVSGFSSSLLFIYLKLRLQESSSRTNFSFPFVLEYKEWSNNCIH